jgi:excisionase family DNA binding protein
MTNRPTPANNPGDLYAAIARDFERQARHPEARTSFSRWRRASPLLAGFASPSDTLATIRARAAPDALEALLAELLQLAGGDPLAQLAVLVAVIPGLQSVAGRRWRLARPDGVWRDRHDLDADVLTAAWLAIDNAARQHHERPAKVVIRQAERQVRTIHQTYLRSFGRTIPLDSDLERRLAARSESTLPEEASARLVDAVRTHRLDLLDAAVAHEVAVGGTPVSVVARQLGLSRSTARESLRDAHRAMDTRQSVPAPTAASKEIQTVPVNNDLATLPLLLTISQTSQLIGVSRTTLYKLMDKNELLYVHIGASRRVPLHAAYDFVDRLCGGGHLAAELRSRSATPNRHLRLAGTDSTHPADRLSHDKPIDASEL